MINYFKFFICACMCTCFAFTVTSCDKDDFFDNNENTSPEETEANDFDFSTTRDIDLFVDYSGFELYGPVLFSIYTTNPIVYENTDVEYVNEDIKPIFQAYTNEQGKFDATVTLPAYAKVLHVVTGNFMIGLKRVMTEVTNGEAKAVLTNDMASASTRSAFRLKADGVWTDDFSPLYNFSYMIDLKSGANKNTQIYKEWATPLGQWNTASGRVNYLMSPSVRPELQFPQEVVSGLYQTVCDALNSGTTCKESYRAGADLTLTKESEVSICALGSRTCWNNSLGYYYYNENNKPTSPLELNPIMLFPNTQDGKRYDNCDYNGSIGMDRGDVIQLMYYPNIANGDFSGATTVFPKGTKIGFLVKSNGWGCIDNDHSFNYGGWKTKKMNIWAASTDGLSYCGDTGYKYPNTACEARTAKFAYTSKNGNKYAIVSFEDACDDKDYDDLVFALNPANAFAELPEVEKGKTTISGIYSFEDLWPERGDYDMNDVMVDCKHEMDFSGGNINKEIYRLTTYQNEVGKVSGLAVRLTTKVAPKSIIMKKIAPGKNDATTITFTKDDQENVYFLTSDVTGELNSTYIFELTYASAQPIENLATIEPFIYRDEKDGKRWEVHLPGQAPTSKMNMDYFGTSDDASDPVAGKWYVRKGLYPFAFYLANASAEMFLNTILNVDHESESISTFYPEFFPWAISKGTQYEDWYLHPKGAK